MTPAQVVSQLKKFNEDLPVIVGTEMVEFALDNFDKQGFQGNSFKQWKVKNPKPGRTIGVKTGRGRRSIRYKKLSEGRVEAGTDLDYMAALNEGKLLKVRLTVKSRKFFWAMFYKTNNPKWKNMALTKKKVLSIQLPELKFIDNSPALDQRIQQKIDVRLKKILS
ncbi:MAG: hypothetical protein AAFY41_18025 [Bacteroidota bacterium]